MLRLIEMTVLPQAGRFSGAKTASLHPGRLGERYPGAKTASLHPGLMRRVFYETIDKK